MRSAELRLNLRKFKPRRKSYTAPRSGHTFTPMALKADSYQAKNAIADDTMPRHLITSC
jgi:hypothetical protein